MLLLTSSLRAEEFPQQSPTDTPRLGLVNGDHVNVRAGPALNYEVLWSLPRGTEVRIVDKKGNIAHVMAPFHEVDPTAYTELGEAIKRVAGPN